MVYRFFFILLLIQQIAFDQIIITEIMYDLDGTDSPNEFIEIYNDSPDTISLSGWSIKDKSSEDFLIDSSGVYHLVPESYAIILEGDYSVVSGIYADIVPPNVPVYFVDDASIGNGLSTTDSLWIMDSSGIVVDFTGWDDIATDGYSIERVRLDSPFHGSNMLQSLDSLGTPGNINSVFPHSIDGKIIVPETWTINDTLANFDSLHLHVSLSNIGLLPLMGHVNFIWENDTIHTMSLPEIFPLDTLALDITLGPFSSGLHTLLCFLSIPGDENNSNNFLSVDFGVRFDPWTITLNEFLPIPVSGGSEFIEVLNVSNEPIRLKNWKVMDATQAVYRLPDSIIVSNQYCVLTESDNLIVPDSSLNVIPDQGLPSLNNTGDVIRIFDPFGTLIDSLHYNIDWGYSEGISMEKYQVQDSSWDASSWAPSNHNFGSTPGYRNSIMPYQIDGGLVEYSMSSIPRIPGHLEPFTIQMSVHNPGLNPITQMSVSLLIQSNLLTIPVNESLIPGDTISVESSLDGLPAGSYPCMAALYLENDGNPLNNVIQDTIHISYPFGSVSINEFLSAPNNDQSEFVELVAHDTIQFRGWTLHDSRSGSSPFPSMEITPYHYITIASDSIAGFENPYPIIFDDAFPSLNNSGDIIRILDHTGTTIDSLDYTSDWDIEPEISLEKLHPDLLSSEPSHWMPCTAMDQMTPGTLNSVTLLRKNGTIVSMDISPLYPENHEAISITMVVTNNGQNDISGVMTIETDDKEIGEISIPILSWRDSCTVSTTIEPLESGVHPVVAFLFVHQEEFYADNVFSDTVRVSYPFGAASINEFLAIPNLDQCEFVEIFNPDRIHLNGWGIGDNTGSISVLSTNHDSEYVTIMADSSLITIADNIHWEVPKSGLPSLNNSEDSIILHDMTGRIIDSLDYSDNWPLEPGRSLEKFRPDYLSASKVNWALNIEIDGISPGEQNSVHVGSLSSAGEIDLSPDPFSPDGDGQDDVLTIHYKTPFMSPIARIRCFDILGRPVRALLWDQPTPQEHTLFWDGRDDQNQMSRIGIYLIEFKFKDQVTGQYWDGLRPVVLARPL